MNNYFNAKFNVNQYHLMGNLLAYSYRFESILSDESNNGYQNMTHEEKKRILVEFKEFIRIARNLIAIQALLNYGNTFDKQPNDEARSKLGTDMNNRLAKLSTVKSKEKLTQIENQNVAKAFNKLMQTDFYRSILGKALKHKENLKQKFERYKQIANETIQPILDGLDKKDIEILVLPPELFDDPFALNTQGKQVSTIAAYPDSFNSKIHNLDIIAMMHEIMHTYIPLNNKQFKNDTQGNIYKVINHCLVELSSNGELGIKVGGQNNYFSTPMHQEILRSDVNVLKKEDYINRGVSFPKVFEFESATEGFKGKIVTKIDELSNDKIRGIVYPYFLSFKNRLSQNPIQSTLKDIARDKKALIEIYGKEFYELIFNENYLMMIQELTIGANNIVELNDVVAENVFGIETNRVIQDNYKSVQELGKETLKEQKETVYLYNTEQVLNSEEKELDNTKYNFQVL